MHALRRIRMIILIFGGQLGQFINGPWIINGLRENEINFGVKAVPACTGIKQDAAVDSGRLLYSIYHFR